MRSADLRESIDKTAIPESLVAQLRTEFAKFVRVGPDGHTVRVGADGHIKVKEIGGVMAAMGYNPSSEWLRSVVTEVDRTGVGNVTIDFQTFLQLVLQRRSSSENSASGGNVSGPLIVTNVNRVDMIFTLLLASLSVNTRCSILLL
jgi:Ca2+-binding EF-hand superfamily protein